MQTPGGGGPAGAGRIDQIRQREGATPRSNVVPLPPKVGTPIPSVFTPTALVRKTSGYPFSTPTDDSMGTTTSSKPPMSTEDLNRLQAKVLRAKLMDDPNAEALEEEYDNEVARAEQGSGDQGGAGMWEGSGEGQQGQMGRAVNEDGKRVDVQVLPTLDGRGRLYDVGTGKEDEELRRGNKRKKQEKVSHTCSTADSSLKLVIGKATFFDTTQTTTSRLWASSCVRNVSGRVPKRAWMPRWLPRSPKTAASM